MWLARIMADGMSKALGQNIIIENVGGAGGTIGTARAPQRPNTTAIRCSPPAWARTYRHRRSTPT